MIFSTSGYTQPAELLAGYLGSQTILLWYPQEIKLAVEKGRIVPLLEVKYRLCVEEGTPGVNVAFMGVL